MQKNPGLEGFRHRKMIPDLFQKIKKEVIWRIERFSKDTAYPIKPEKLVVDVRNTLDQNDIVISDVGAHKLWIAKVYNTYFPNTCLITNGFCSMGFALPGAIAARLKLPIIVVIWCDCDFERNRRSIRCISKAS